MSRLTRDEIRRDEVREAVFSASTWFAEHVRQILMGVAAAIAVVVGVVLFLNYRDGREQEASYLLSQALEVYRAPIDAPATDAKPRPSRRPSRRTGRARTVAGRATSAV